MLRSALVPLLIESEYALCSVSLSRFLSWFLSSSILCHWYFYDCGRHWRSRSLSTSGCYYSFRCYGCRDLNGLTYFLRWCRHYYRKPLWLMWFHPNLSCHLLGSTKQYRVTSLRRGLFSIQSMSYFSNYWPTKRRKYFRDHVKSLQS